jgi:hypothetical protein
MSHTLTYFSLCSAAGLIAYFSGSISLGTFVPFGFWVIYLQIFADGVVVGSGVQQITIWYAVSTYFAAIVLWAVVGALGSLALKQFRFLSGEETALSKRYRKAGQTPAPSGLSFFLFWVWFLLWQLGTLVLIEIEADGYDFTIAGFLTVGLQLIGWLVYYLVGCREAAYFEEGDDPRKAAWTPVLWNGAVYLVFGLTYVSCQVGLSETKWFTERWNFYVTMILAAVAFAVYLVAYATISGMQKEKYRPMPMESALSFLKLDKV